MNIETLKTQVKAGVEFAMEGECCHFYQIYRITNASGEYVLFAYVDKYADGDEVVALFPQWHEYEEGYEYEFDRGGSAYGLGAKRIQPGSDVAAEIADLVANSAALARQFLTGNWTKGLPDYYIVAEDEEIEALAKAAMIADGMDIWG